MTVCQGLGVSSSGECLLTLFQNPRDVNLVDLASAPVQLQNRHKHCWKALQMLPPSSKTAPLTYSCPPTTQVVPRQLQIGGLVVQSSFPFTLYKNHGFN